MTQHSEKHHPEFQNLLGRIAEIKYELNKDDPELSLKHFEGVQYYMRLLPDGPLKKEVAASYGIWTVKLKKAKDSELKDMIDEACKDLIKLLN
jgi:hypothetical protein